MPSILFISLMNEASWGESEELWYRSALFASSKGYSIGCAFFNWEGKESKIDELENSGCKIFLLPNKGKQQRNIIERIQFKLSRASLKKYIDLLPINNYKTIIINTNGMEIILPEFQEWYKKFNNYFLLFHNYTTQHIFKENESTNIRAWISSAAKNLFASEKIKESLENKLNFHIQNAETLINPICFSIPVAPVSFVKQNQYVFTMLAPIDISLKAQDKLIKAFASPKWLQRNFVLHIYGEGKDRDRLENYIARKGLSKKIIIKGVYNVKEVLRNTHILLHITHLDAMPSSVLEAMAFSRPVIVSPVGDMPLWVRNGENGWITKDSTSDQMEIVLEMAWNNRTRWEAMGKKSFEIFTSQYPQVVEENFLEKVQVLVNKEEEKNLDLSLA